MAPDTLDTASLFKALAWLEKNKKQVVVGTATVLGVGLVVFFITWRSDQKRIEAGQAFSSVFAGESAAGSNATAAPYLTMASRFPGTKPAERATLLAASTLFSQGKYAEAQAEFEKIKREFPASQLVPQALLGIAACLEAQDKPDQALSAYKDIVDRRVSESILPQAKFELARLYENKKDVKQAYDLYKDVSTADPFGSMGDEASVRLKDLEFKDPSLAVTPASTTPVAPTIAGTNVGPAGTKSAANGGKK